MIYVYLFALQLKDVNKRLNNSRITRNYEGIEAIDREIEKEKWRVNCVSSSLTIFVTIYLDLDGSRDLWFFREKRRRRWRNSVVFTSKSGKPSPCYIPLTPVDKRWPATTDSWQLVGRCTMGPSLLCIWFTVHQSRSDLVELTHHIYEHTHIRVNISEIHKFPCSYVYQKVIFTIEIRYLS